MAELRFPSAIDNTMRSGLVKCQMLAHYEHEMGLQPLSPSVDLHAGGAFAAGMEAVRKEFYVHGKSPEVALVCGIDTLHAEYGNFSCPSDSNKSADRMAGALAFYLGECPIEDEELLPVLFQDGTRGIEMSFNYPIGMSHPDTGKELTYCGRYDLLAKHCKTGKVWVVDEKTTSQLGPKWSNQWVLDGGLSGYVWGAQRLLHERNMDLEVAGAVVNGVAIKLRDYAHTRFETFRQDWQVDRWYGQMIKDVYTWREAYAKQDHNQVLGHVCALYNNPCKFDRLCLSRNPERLIEGNYVVRFWDPRAKG